MGPQGPQGVIKIPQGPRGIKKKNWGANFFEKSIFENWGAKFFENSIFENWGAEFFWKFNFAWIFNPGGSGGCGAPLARYKVWGLHYPKAQQSCVPATAPRAKVIKQLSVCPSVRQPVCQSVLSVQSEYIEFRWSGDRKYWLLVVRRKEIFNFSAPEKEKIEF